MTWTYRLPVEEKKDGPLVGLYKDDEALAEEARHVRELKKATAALVRKSAPKVNRKQAS
jgi:hypothetical protein